MALADLLSLSSNTKKIGVSEERLRAVIPAARKYVAFWREYPDIFVDFLQTGGDFSKKKELNFFFYQRVKEAPQLGDKLKQSYLKAGNP